MVLDASAAVTWPLGMPLAETLDVPLVTLDGRIARAPGNRARVDLIA